jgi:biopolymer transport protein ExbD
MAFGSFDQQGGNQPMSEINVTPLVDVMLVLVIIFIITAPLLTHGIKIDLPKASSTANPEKPETVTLSLDAKQPQPELHLRADQNTRYQKLAEIMSAARNAGLTKLGFVTDPSPAAGQ